MGFLGYRPDFATGVAPNKGNPVLWICTGNRISFHFFIFILYIFKVGVYDSR